MFGLLKSLKFGIPVHEKPRIKFLWSLRFLYQVGFIFVWTVLTSVYLDLFGIENLPYLILGDASLFLLGSFLSNMFFIRFDIRNFLIGTISAVILFVLCSLIFIENSAIFFISAIIAKALFYSQVHIGILRKNESLFSPEEAKRTMPLIDSAVTLGTIFAAIMFLVLLKFMPTEKLLAFWLFPLIGLFWLVVKSPQILSETPSFHEVDLKKEKIGFKGAFKSIRKTSFLSLMMIIVFIQSSLFMVAEFKFLKSVQDHSIQTEVHFDHNKNPHLLETNLIQDLSEKAKKVAQEVKAEVFVHQSLAHDLGVLSLFFGIIALIFQLFLASRILEKFGIINTMLLHSLGFLTVILSFVFGGVSMNVIRGYQHGVHSLFESAYHMTFYSIFSNKRELIRHFFEGVIRPLGVILGTLLVMLVLKFELFALSWLMLFLIVFLVFLVFPIKKEFTLLTKNNLFMDKSLLAKIHSIETLGQKGHDEALAILSEELLRTSRLDVQEKIIKTLSKIGDSAIIHVYVDILTDKKAETELKILILNSLLSLKSLRSYWGEHAFSQHHLLKILRELFAKSKHKYIKKLVIMNIFMHLPHHQVVPFFLETINTADDDLKSVCLRSSAELFADPEIKYYLKKYLSDTNPRLRGHAVIALAPFYNQSVLDTVLSDLLHTNNQESLIAGIYAVGETQNLKFLQELYDLSTHKSYQIRQHALVALAKLDQFKIIPQLLEFIFDNDEFKSRSVLSMLQRKTSKEFMDVLRNEIHLEVSKNVLTVLVKHKIKKRDHLINLSKEIRLYLIRLYKLSEKYDHVIMFEEVLKK